MYEFRAIKLAGRVYGTRAEYLAARAALNENEPPPAKVDPMLCNSIARANAEFVDEDPAPDVVPAHFPWLTVVLGSGCATETTDPAGLTPLEPKLIEQILRSRAALCDEVLPSDLARQFAERLISERLRHVREIKPGTAVLKTTDNADDTKRVALLVLSAALATGFYREVAAVLQLPLDRRGADCISLKTSVTPSRLAELVTKFKAPLLEVIDEVSPLLIKHGNSLAESHILARIKSSLTGIAPNGAPTGRQELSRLDVQILTEFCWLALTEQCSIYHGWSELLALLARLDPTRLDPPVRYPLQPSLSRENAIDAIQNRYRRVSEDSWKNRKLGTASNRHAFFDGVANVLCQQAVLRTQIAARGAVLPPVASAFSTSFDLELEMALTARADLPGFVIALPAQYLGTNSKVASLQWLGAVFRKPSGLDAILDGPSEWVMLSRMTWNDDWEYANWPFVVHLAGCPLIKPPEVKLAPKLPPTGSADANRRMKLEKVEDIQSAILLDEYSAIQQHSTEMFGASSESNGLPDDLTKASPDSAKARFWMIMGVQMQDTAVRYWVASRLGTGRKGLDQTSVLPERAGLVVTSKLDPTARDLMQWYGFDIVQQDCSEFKIDLDHYSKHLELDNALGARLAPFHQKCKLR